MSLDRITILCFAASYALALVLELSRLASSARLFRWLALAAAVAGLIAHGAYLTFHGLPQFGEAGTLLLVALILAVFYVCGSVHHRHQAWGVFVLPVVLILVGLGWFMPDLKPSPANVLEEVPPLWVGLHVSLLVLGAVGLGVAFVASLMYLVQAWKLRHKIPPGQGLHLLSLERLEDMNRRGIAWAFPLLSGGLLTGLILIKRTELLSWSDPKVLATAGLWLVFVTLIYLRYGLHLRGRRVAVWTILAFGLLVFSFTIQFLVPSGHRYGGVP